MFFIQQNDVGRISAIPKIKKWVIIMKLTLLLTVFCMFKLSANTFAQKVSLKAENSPLVKVMQSIQKQSGIPFLLNGKDLANTKINANLKEVSLQTALESIFSDKPIGWEMVDGTIVLKRSNKPLIKGNSAPVSTDKAQEKVINGKVSNSFGEAIAGASVKEKGTSKATSTDENGNYSISISQNNSTLIVSFIGYETQEVAVGNQSTVNIVLKESSDDLDEVVVMGYGTIKKKLSTGATIQVKGDDIQKLSTPNVLEALQSQSPGVQITQTSGMPGESFKVTIRGLGTIGNSNPLYIIDGIPGGDMDLINSADIESIDILKDAASAAIYGSRAANGVVLVTTKQGKEGKIELHLDSYFGFQNAYKLPSLLTAKEYMAIQDERRFNEGAAPYNWSTLIPKQYAAIQDGSWNGTNWIKEILNENAPLQNLALNLMGGSGPSKYSFGYSVTDRQGIFGKPVEPNFQRHTFRLNSNHVVLTNDDFNVITFGENLYYANFKSAGLGIGNIYWNDIHNILVGNPLLPVYNESGEFYDQPSKVADAWTLDGSLANPLAEMYYRRGQNASKSHSLSANAYLEIQPIKNLIFKSNFGYRLNTYTYRSYTPVYELSTTLSNAVDDISQNQGQGYNWVLENTLKYKFNPLEDHTLDVLVGQSLEKGGIGEDLGVTTSNTTFPGQWDKAWVSNAQGYEGFIPSVFGVHYPQGSLSSFFGRAIYDIKETYLASLTLRADGSSNFARGNRWGYFPSASLGWVASNESFLQGNETIDFLKFRVSWGQNGNASINPFQYLATIATNNQNGYYFGNSKSLLNRGSYPDILPNPDVTWETSEQTNIGVDARFIKSKLSLVLDWYRKTTKDWLVQAPVLAIYGTGAPYINGGDVRNQGIEFGLSWKDKKGDFDYGITINGAHNKNKVLRIANSEGIIHGASDVLSQGTKEMYRAQVDYPIGYFYGFKTDGIFQNQEQIEALRAQGLGVLPTAQPGDVAFVDMNKDGSITDDDKVMIGNPHPDFSGGLSFNFGYKGIDLGITTFGNFGHQIAKSYRSFADSPLQNYTTEIFDRWHGEGTSNKVPRLTSGSHTNNQYISDIYIENGDFVKIQNVTLGYDFSKLWKKSPFSQTRIYATVQNLYTITKYSGMDPEIGYGYDQPWVSGIDLGFYPQPRTVMFGLNLKF